MTMMTDAKRSLTGAELALEVARERIDPDAFDGLSVAMQGVAEVLPVGGLVAGTGKARIFDEGFKQDGPVGVAGVPVIGQSSAHQGEGTGGEVFAVYPRQDEEAGIVHDEVQVALSLIARPTDELIAGIDLPGARAEAKGRDDVAGGAHEVAQLGPGHELVSEVMVPFDIGIPQQRVGFGENRIDAKGGQFDGRYAGWLTDRLFDVRVGAVGDGLGISRRWQADEPIGLHSIERYPATHILQGAVVAPPAESFADLARQTGAVDPRDLKQLADQIDVGGCKVTSAVLHRSARVEQACLPAGAQ